MLRKISRHRLILMLLIIAGLGFALLRNTATTATATGNSNPVPVIVELRDDPAAVYKAKSAKSGVAVSDDAMKSYREQLRARQDDFLTALAARR